MTKNEFIELVIAYGANGTAETETYTERQQSIVAQAWAAFSKEEDTKGNETSEEYCKEAYDAAEAYYYEFYEAQIVSVNGQEFELSVALHYMDKDIAEELHGQDFESEQAFVDAYIKAHSEKYGEEFQIN